MSRPDWDTYFADLTRLVASRSTCLRAQHGSLVVKDNRILATGYNGSPPGTYHCSEASVCYRQARGIPSGQMYELCRAIHAEQNVIVQAGKFGIPLKGATLYITDVPCELCAKQIHAVGITEVVILQPSGRYCTKALHDFELAGNTVRYLDKEKTDD